jgi:2-aminoadipate transaminase
MSTPGGRQPRSAAHEIERYAALFADRTSVMKSSAMRDLMALTARDDVISFSGGLPDTSTFAPGFFTEIMGRVASQYCAKALQYGPTEGLDSVRERITEVMAAEGMTADPDWVLPSTWSARSS